MPFLLLFTRTDFVVNDYYQEYDIGRVIKDKGPMPFWNNVYNSKYLTQKPHPQKAPS